MIAFNASYRMRMLTAIIMFTVGASFMIGGEFLMAMWAFQGEAAFALELIGLVGVSFVAWNLASVNWTKKQYAEATTDIRAILRNWLTAQDMAMGLRRVFDILDTEPDVKDKPDAVPMTTSATRSATRTSHSPTRLGRPVAALAGQSGDRPRRARQAHRDDRLPTVPAPCAAYARRHAPARNPRRLERNRRRHGADPRLLRLYASDGARDDGVEAGMEQGHDIATATENDMNQGFSHNGGLWGFVEFTLPGAVPARGRQGPAGHHHRPPALHHRPR